MIALGKFGREQFEVTQYLGNMIGRNDKYMKDIACMSQEYRLLRSYLETVFIVSDKLAEGLTKDQETKLRVICEVLERIGQADWQMDVVSHLSMKIGKAYKSYDGE